MKYSDNNKISFRFFSSAFVTIFFILLGTFIYNQTANNQVFGVTKILTTHSVLYKLNDNNAALFSQNNIVNWNPNECDNSKNGNIRGDCGGEITATGTEERLRETIEKYGIVAINMQIEYGIPWELPFVHMWMESGMGAAGPGSVAYSVEQCGYVNWMGYTYSSSSLYGIPESEMSCVVHHAEGMLASQYENIADMMGALATDFLRNGAYDSAYDYATPSNFDARTFLAEVTDKQGRCTGSYYCECGCHAGYLDVYDQIISTIHEVGSEKGWPTSEELAKQKNIPKGGNWPVQGDIKDQINAAPHSLHMSCSGNIDSGSSSSPSTTNNNNTSSNNNSNSSKNLTTSSPHSVSGSNITWIGDSYSCGALDQIKAKFPGISFGGSECDANSYILGNKGVSDNYCGNSCASNPSALTILKRVIDAGELKPYLVMAVGTNAGWTDSEINQFKSIISSHPETKVVFVTVKARDDAGLVAENNGTNERLKKLTDSNDNYYLADWAAAYDASYFAENPTHPTVNGGYEKWVEIIADALSGISTSKDPCDPDPTSAGEKIAEVAISISMPEDKASEADKGKTTAKYDQLLEKWGLSSGTNCSKVAGLAIMESGVDPDFVQVDPNSSEFVAGANQNWRWAGELKEYLDKSPNWKKVTNKTYLPGDVFTNGSHVFVYVGDGKVAESGVGGWAARIRPFTEESHGGYPAYRIKTSDNNKTTTSGNSNILNDTAIDLAWSLEEADKANTEPKSTYKNAMKETGLENEFAGNYEGKSCDQFVRTVVQYALKDTEYPSVSKNQYDYIVNTKSNEYTEVPFESTKGGDIVFFSTDNPFNPNSIQHTAIVVENDDGRFLAEASLGDYYGKIVNFRTLNRTTKAFRKNNLSSTGGSNSLCCDEDANNSSHSGGFTSTEEAEKVVMNPYRDLFGHPELWKSEYHLTSDLGPDNCFSFVNYFISVYTSIDKFYGVPEVDGGGLADQFYELYHSDYPALKKSSTPVAYGVASCGDVSYTGNNYSHTFMVLGINGDKMIIGEAGYGSGLGYTHAKEFNLSGGDMESLKHNGSGSIPCTFVDINAYIKGL